jgi:hypothetical protein
MWTAPLARGLTLFWRPGRVRSYVRPVFTGGIIMHFPPFAGLPCVCGINDAAGRRLKCPWPIDVLRRTSEVGHNPREYIGHERSTDPACPPVVGQFEFPFLAGTGMAGLGDGNRATDIRAAWLRIGFPRRWVAPVGKIATSSPLVTHGGDGLLRDEKRE